ncbi:MAG TPA: hypothetical protein VNA22_06990 [Pyrinomonadaceae bacterium]|nr:hypothetical protein [Pyrinomonadaceae bacterium]
MKAISAAWLVIKVAIATTLLLVSTTVLFGQDKMDKLEKVGKLEAKMAKGFCEGDNWSNGDKVSARDLREMTIPSTSLLAVDGGKNGGIKVKGSERSDILVRACIQGWGTTEEAARGLVNSVKISTTGTVKADAPEENHWGVSYEILVPRNIDLNLRAHNGGISVGGVKGRLEFETLNGGLHLADIAGDVKGRTTNGGVHVRLVGDRWDGSGLDLVTTNGGVHVSISDSYAANIETGTTNGGFHSTVPGLSVNKDDQKDRYHRSTKLNASLNGGGAPIRLMTTNGGVHFSSASKSAY